MKIDRNVMITSSTKMSKFKGTRISSQWVLYSQQMMAFMLSTLSIGNFQASAKMTHPSPL